MELTQLKQWGNLRNDSHGDNWICDFCINRYDEIKGQCASIGVAVERNLFPEFIPVVCTGIRPLCEQLMELTLDNRGWRGPTRIFNEIASVNKEIFKLDPVENDSHGFTTFSMLRRQVRAYICSHCYYIDADVCGRTKLDASTYSPVHKCPSKARKRHNAHSVMVSK